MENITIDKELLKNFIEEVSEYYRRYYEDDYVITIEEYLKYKVDSGEEFLSLKEFDDLMENSRVIDTDHPYYDEFRDYHVGEIVEYGDEKVVLYKCPYGILLLEVK
jgi:hypothetical protein